MIRVVITCGEEDLFLKLPPLTTVLQLKTRWANKYSSEVQNLQLPTEGQLDLRDGSSIGEIAEDPSKVLQMWMQEAVEVAFSVMGSDKAPIQLSMFLSALPSTQLPKLRQQLAIEEDRPVRLLVNGTALDPALSFEEQHVVGSSAVAVELGWRVHLRSEWTSDGDLAPISCFSGDLVRPTLTASCAGDFHLFHEGKLLGFCDSIAGSLKIAYPESRIDQFVQVRIPRKFFVMDSNAVREVSVFDSTTVGELGLNCSSALMCDAEVMSSSRKLIEGAGNTLLLADVCVVVVLSHEEPRKRRRCVVRLSARATVYDLWSKVMKIEGSRMINLYFRGRRLDDLFTELRDLGIESGSSVSCQKEPPLCIKMRTSCGKDATFSAPEMRSVTYSDLMRFHKAKDDRKDSSCAFLKGLSFKCNGCQRLISRDLDGRQLVPAPCCDVASLDLTTVHHSADKAAQTCEAKRQRSDIHLDIEGLTDATSQTELLTEEASSQVERQDRDRSVMALSFWNVRFDIYEPSGKNVTCIIDKFPTDSLQDLLERVSQKTNCRLGDFSFVFQFECGKDNDGRVRYLAENTEEATSAQGEVTRKIVYANQARCEASLDVFRSMISLTNVHVAEIDDIFCSPGLVPNISVDLRAVYFELDSSAAFTLIPTTVEALSDPQCVAWIESFRLSDAEGVLPSEMLLVFDSGCVDMDSGEVFGTRRDAMRASKIPQRNLRDEYCYILLRHNSHLPKWRFALDSADQCIAIRDGCDFSIQGGRIQMKTTTPLVLSKRWISPKCLPGVRIPPDSQPHNLKRDIVQFMTS